MSTTQIFKCLHQWQVKIHSFKILSSTDIAKEISHIPNVWSLISFKLTFHSFYSCIQYPFIHLAGDKVASKTRTAPALLKFTT